MARISVAKLQELGQMQLTASFAHARTVINNLNGTVIRWQQIQKRTVHTRAATSSSMVDQLHGRDVAGKRINAE
jgi:hypothetical protein